MPFCRIPTISRFAISEGSTRVQVEDNHVAKISMKAVANHLWLLTPKLVPKALLCDDVGDEACETSDYRKTNNFQ